MAVHELEIATYSKYPNVTNVVFLNIPSTVIALTGGCLTTFPTSMTIFT